MNKILKLSKQTTAAQDAEVGQLADSTEVLQWALDTLTAAAARRCARALKLTDVPGPAALAKLIRVEDLQLEINYLTAEKELHDVSTANRNKRG